MRLFMESSYRRYARGIALASSIAALTAACSQNNYPARSLSSGASVDRPTFTEADYGVRSSRRVQGSGPVPKGGGIYKIGNPYRVAGRWYVPRQDPNYDRAGTASWYGDDFHGRRTANGEIFDRYALTAAHPTLPLPSYVYVTNLENRRTVLLRVNDRGPYVSNRIIDLSHAAAAQLGYVANGHARVRVKYAGRAPLNGDDRSERRFLEAQRRLWNGTAVAGDRTTAPPPYRTAALGREEPAAQWSPTAYRARLAGMPAPVEPMPTIGAQRFASASAMAYEPTASLAPRRQPSSERTFVQIGLFRDVNNAERLRRQFGHLGPVEVAPMPSDRGAPLYRVRLGPMTETAAQLANREIAGHGIPGSAIVTD